MKRVLIIRLSSLGDVLLTTPVVRALKKKYPDCKIDFLVRNQYSDVLRYNQNLNRIYEFNPPNVKELLNELKQNNYDFILDLQNNFRSRKITLRLKTKVYRFKKLSVRKFLLVNFKINLMKNSKSIVERYAESFPEIQLDNHGLEIFIPKELENKIQNFNKDSIIGFCPGSKHFTKRWLPEYFVELGKKLSNDGFTILIFGGKDDESICSKISRQIPNSINLQNNNEILLTAAYMKKCKLIVTNDSGLMHTASAVKTPVLVIFGSSVKEFGFLPYKIKNIILENENLRCRPCSHIGKEGCPKDHFKCMKDLTPDFVYNHLINFLKEL